MLFSYYIVVFSSVLYSDRVIQTDRVIKTPWRLLNLPTFTSEQQEHLAKIERDRERLIEETMAKYQWLVRQGEEEYDPDRYASSYFASNKLYTIKLNFIFNVDKWFDWRA